MNPRTLERVRVPARLHSAIDEAELVRLCGEAIEAMAGPVPWRLRLAGMGRLAPTLHVGVGATLLAPSDCPPESLWESAAVPLLFREHPVGDLVVGPSHCDSETLRELADHLAAAVMKLSLWSDAEEKARRNRIDREMLRDLHRVIAGFDPECVLARALELVLRFVGSDVGSVCRWHGTHGSDGVFLGLQEQVTGAVLVEGKPVTNLVAERGLPLLIEEPEIEGGPHAGGFELRRLLVLPLERRGHVVGVMHAANPLVESPDSPKISIACEICRIAATAIENAHLHDELIRQERMAAAGQVIGGLAHDIKNLVHGMQYARQLIEQSLERDDLEGIRALVPQLGVSTDGIASLALNMLDYATVRTPSREPEDLNELVKKAVLAVQGAGSTKGVKPRLLLDPSMEPVWVDSVALCRCLTNLLINAIEAVPFEGKVEVRTRWLPGEPDFEVIVSDEGLGIRQEDGARIFDAFFTTKRKKGTGLGLAVAKKIVEEHRGTISVRPGETGGTVFTVRLAKEKPEQVQPSSGD